MSEHVQKVCKHHGLTTFYKSPRSMSHFKCAKCNTEGVTRRRRQVIAILKAEHGGCCTLCGYSTCIEALEFHHKDPNSKERAVNNGSTLSLETLRAEAAKCVLLCANCHREVHAGLRVL